MREEVEVMKKKLGWFVAGAAVLALAAPANAAGPYQYIPVTPCRFVDTRDATLQGGTGQYLTTFVVKTFTAKGRCGIPMTAQALSLNVTIANPTGAGFLTLYPTGVAKPWISVINWTAADYALANGAVLPLGVSSTMDVSAYQESNGGGTVDMILDVTGYFQ